MRALCNQALDKESCSLGIFLGDPEDLFEFINSRSTTSCGHMHNAMTEGMPVKIVPLLAMSRRGFVCGSLFSTFGDWPDNVMECGISIAGLGNSISGFVIGGAGYQTFTLREVSGTNPKGFNRGLRRLRRSVEASNKTFLKHFDNFIQYNNEIGLHNKNIS